jgi:hypothetical protein
VRRWQRLAVYFLAACTATVLTVHIINWAELGLLSYLALGAYGVVAQLLGEWQETWRDK